MPTPPLVNVRLGDDLTAQVDRIATEQATTRSAVLRDAIRSYVAHVLDEPANTDTGRAGPD